jgi:hypothetical protein
MASLSGVFNLQEFSDLGALAAGYRLYTYAPGTTTLKIAYTDAAGAIPHTYTNDGLGGQYIALNARGELPAPLFLLTGGYDITLKSAAGVTVWTRRAIGGSDSSDALRTEMNTAAGGDFTLPLGAYTYIFGDGVADNSDAITAANAAGKSVFVVGRLNITSPRTLTVPIVDTMARIFTDSSQITIANGQPVRPEWFGSTAGNIMRAVNALPSSGGTVKLANRVYPPSYNSLTGAMVANGSGTPGVDYLAKSNVTFEGEQSGTVKSDLSGAENGSIIQGPFFYHASGLRFHRLSVDSGSAVCAALYGGVAQEGLCGVQINKTAPVFYRDCVLEDVRAVCKGASEAVHAILMEACIGLTANNVIGYSAGHTLVCKSRNALISNSAGIESGIDAIITKSDDYAPAEGVKWVNCDATSWDGTLDAGFGILTEAVGAPASAISYANCRVRNKANGFCARSNGAVLADVTYSNLNVEACPVGVLLSGDVRRTTGQGVVINNSTYAVQVEDAVTDISNSIVGLKITNAVDGIRAGGRIVVDDVNFDGISGYCLNYPTVAARIKIDNYTTGTSITGTFWPLQPGALTNSWVNEGSAGAPVFRVVPDGGRIRLSGRIKSGVAAQVLAALSVQIRPSEDVSVKISGLNGATQTTATLQVVSSTGQILVPDYAASPTWVQLEASWPIPI